MRTPIGIVGVLATLLVMATACGSTTAGHPASTPSAAPPSSKGPTDVGQTLPHDGAPKVPDPVDVARFKAAPCTVLTKSQLDTLGITGHSRSRPDNPTGSACDWESGIDGVNIGINFIRNTGGLSDLYELHRQGKFAVFETSAPINGFPAVLDLPDDTRSSGDCSYAVGFNDRDAMFVQLGERPGGNPCDDVKQVALSVTKTVKEGGS